MLNYIYIKQVIIFFIIINCLPTFGGTPIFDADGNLISKEPEIRYQWIDPKTGQTVTKPYPPANLQMRQVERRSDGTVILEIIGKTKFADVITKPPTLNASSSSYKMYTNLPELDKDKIRLAIKRETEITTRGTNPPDLKALIDAKKRFDDAHELAARTPRVSLAGPIARMQDVRQEVERQPVAECYQEAQQALVKWMNILLDKMTGFMSGRGVDADLYASGKSLEAMDQILNFWLTTPLECN